MTPQNTSALITSLITQLSSYQSPLHTTSPTDNASDTNNNTSKNILLTLHCLFPNDLLLALDIIDRRLIRRFYYTSPQYDGGYDDRKHSGEMEMKESSREVFFVDSTTSNASSSTLSSTHTGKKYEVRLDAWNCSCPAFAMRAFQAGSDDCDEDYQGLDDNDDVDGGGGGGGGGGDGWFGGTLVRMPQKRRLPVCKHLLACVLAAKCKGHFGNGIVEERGVDRTELAGWCAGFAM